MPITQKLVYKCSDHTYRQSEPESSIGKYSKDYANLPERYVIRKTTNLLYKSEKDEPATPPEVRLVSDMEIGDL